MLKVAKQSAGLVLSSLVFAMLAHAAQAADPEFRLSAGVRAWVNSWESWDVVNGAVAQYSSSQKLALTPVVQARYGDAYAMGSYMAETKYSLKGSGASIDDASRKEADVAIGYYVLPSLGAALGYKNLEQKFGNTKYKWSGPTLSLSGSAPLGSGVLLYGSAGLGLLKGKFPGQSSLDANYLLSEVGIGYSLMDKGAALKALVLTAGIRSQALTTKDFAVTGSTSQAKQDVKDITHGAVVGVTGSF